MVGGDEGTCLRVDRSSTGSYSRLPQYTRVHVWANIYHITNSTALLVLRRLCRLNETMVLAKVIM